MFLCQEEDIRVERLERQRKLQKASKKIESPTRILVINTTRTIIIKSASVEYK